ncbi:MAG TPA: NAD-dependent epimerase/dehydratase family protein [Spirochaetota bacterium]
MNILITGGAGFIGSHLSLALLARSHNVTVLDSLSPQIHGDVPENSELFGNIKNKVTFILGDVRNSDDWMTALEGADVVVHLAAETGTGQSMYEIDRYCDANVGGTAKLLDILTNKPHTVKKCIIASSRAVYGEGKYSCAQCGVVYPLDRRAEDMASGDFEAKCPTCGKSVSALPTDEETLCIPGSIYALTKYMQEKMVLMACKGIGIEAAALRFQNVYGPGQSLSNPYTGILSIFSTRMKNGNNINIFEDGKESRDFVYIDDVVASIVLCIENENLAWESFNVGTGVPIDVMTVARTLAEKYGSSSKIEVTGNFRVGDIRTNFADISKIRKRFGYAPKVSFDEGIFRFVEWVNGQDVSADRYDASVDEMRKKGLLK